MYGAGVRGRGDGRWARGVEWWSGAWSRGRFFTGAACLDRGLCGVRPGVGAASGRGVAGFECGGEGAEGGEVGLGEFGVVVADGQGGRRVVRGEEVEDGVGVDAVDGVVAGWPAGIGRGGRVGEADGATGPEDERLGADRLGQAGGVPGGDVEEGVVGRRAARAAAEVGFETDVEGGTGVVDAHS